MRHSYDFVTFVLKYALCRSKRSLKRLAVAFTSISSWFACISRLLQKAQERAKAPLNVALDFENRATRASFSCMNGSYLHGRVLNLSIPLGSWRFLTVHAFQDFRPPKFRHDWAQRFTPIFGR